MELNLVAMIEDVAKTFAETAANKYGCKEVTRDYEMAAGVVTVIMSQDRDRSWRGSFKVSTRFKLNGKVIAKAALLEQLGETTKARENPEMKAAFMAVAPDLANDFAEFITSVFNRIEKARGSVPAYVESRDAAWHDISLIRYCCDFIKMPGDLSGTKATLKLNADTLRKEADKYGKEVALDWFYKTNAKLGDVEEVDVPEGRSGTMVVLAKRNGHSITLDQQRIIKRSPKGKLFHQFPARIYVDGKFYPESAYKKLFA